jgi:predicted  nucleic acid-binding Zn-ribbon protein
MYKDGSKELLEGCSCGSRFFFFIKQSAIEKSKKLSSNLNKGDRARIEKDVEEIVESKTNFKEGPVFLDIESVRVLKPGKYEINLVDLFRKEPLVYKIGDGKYVIDLISTFNLSKNKKTFK